MEKPDCHIFLCCHKKDSVSLLPYIENEILDRGLNAQITSTGCMKACDYGPVLMVYPQGYWYGNVDTEEIVDEILDALEDGNVAEGLLIT